MSLPQVKFIKNKHGAIRRVLFGNVDITDCDFSLDYTGDTELGFNAMIIRIEMQCEVKTEYTDKPIIRVVEE